MHGENPYSSPASDVGSDALNEPPARLETASRGRRFLTFVVDYFGQAVLVFIIMLVMMLVRPGMQAQIESMGRAQEFLFNILGFFVYYVAFEGLFARTPGKLICGTRVVDGQGLPPGFGRVLGRTLARLVPFEPFSVLFSNDDDVRGWHDNWTGTRVVRVR